jgi:hypothetical protein
MGFILVFVFAIVSVFAGFCIKQSYPKSDVAKSLIGIGMVIVALDILGLIIRAIGTL